MLLVMTIGGIIVLSILCRNRRRAVPSKATRTVTTRTIKTVYTPGTKKPADAEKLKRQAEKVRKEQFNRMQAAADLIHYNQVKADLIKAYDSSGALYGDSEKAIRKRIAYDNAIRRTEKQIEKAAYNARRTG